MSEFGGDKDGWLDIAKNLDDPIEFLVAHIIQAFLKSTRGERSWYGLSEEPAYRALCQCIAWNCRVDGWQPIETAPKDGTVILLFASHGAYELAYWDKKLDSWNGPFAHTFGIEEAGLLHPTQWWPLPPPPTGEEA